MRCFWASVILAMLSYRRKGLLRRPILYAVGECQLIDAELFCPSRDTLCASCVCVKNCCARVSLLGPGITPATVVRCVRTISIDSVDRRSHWTFAHIRQKGRKIFQPPLADSYSAAPISPIVMRVRFSATLHHSGPAHVGSGLRSASRMTMNYLRRSIFARLAAIFPAAGSYSARARPKHEFEPALFAGAAFSFNFFAHVSMLSHHAAGRVMAGLTRRRAAEAQLFTALA